MRSAILLLFLMSVAYAQQREVRGTVTYIAGPTIYGSLGRNDGLMDSCSAFIRSGVDTVALLRCMALSSRSSSWSVVKSMRDIAVRDTLIALAGGPQKPDRLTAMDTTPSSLQVPTDYANRIYRRYEEGLSVQGRLSLQYYGIDFGSGQSSFAQPAAAFSIEARTRAIPLRFTIYGVHRQQVRGNLNPLDGSSRPETRLYRVSMEYDDGSTSLLAGRIYPVASVPTSAVDGFSAARRYGNFTAGLAAGAEPTLRLKIRQSHLWKGMAFVGFQATEPFSWGAGLVYSRSYYRRALVRETMSFAFSTFTPSGFALNGFTDIDLRRPLSQSGAGEPSLTSLMLLGSVYVIPELSLFAGVDGARPVPIAADYGIIPDSLFNRTLRSGLTAGSSLAISSWQLNMSVSPRMGEVEFGKEYSATASVGTFNLASSGVEIRSTVNLNTNTFTRYSSYGLQTRKSFLGIDWRLRFNYYITTIRQMNSRRTGTQQGLDIVTMFSSSLSLMATLDFWRGSTFMNVMFVELSWRF